MQTDNSLWEAESRLVAAYVATPPTVDHTLYPNGPSNTPNNGRWVRINSPISNGILSQDASGCYEINSAFMVIQVFAPKGTGSQWALQTAHYIKGLYTKELFDDATVQEVIVTPSPEPSTSPWFGVNCRISFTYEGFTS